MVAEIFQHDALIVSGLMQQGGSDVPVTSQMTPQAPPAAAPSHSHSEDFRLMKIRDGCHLQESKPPVLAGSFVKRLVLLMRGIGWVTGLISRKSTGAYECHVYEYRVILEKDQSIVSVKLPLDVYGAEKKAAVGAWVLLEADEDDSS